MNQNNIIVLTGAAGFIGSAILTYLIQKGVQVVATDKKTIESFQDWGLLEMVHNACKIGQLKYVTGDIRDREFCKTLFHGGEVLIHQAALTSVAESYKEPHLYNEVNIVGYQNIVRGAILAGVNKIVYASSAAADATQLGLEQSEQTLSPYGKTKAINETFSQDIAFDSGASFTGLRYYNVVGSDMHWVRNSEAVIAKWIKEAFLEGAITVFGNGNQIRDFCSIKEVVLANVYSTSRLMPGISRVIEVGSGSGVSMNDLSLTIKKHFAKKFKNSKEIEIIKKKLVDPGQLLSIANGEDCSSSLGFKISGDLNKMLSTIFENFEEIIYSNNIFEP